MVKKGTAVCTLIFEGSKQPETSGSFRDQTGAGLEGRGEGGESISREYKETQLQDTSGIYQLKKHYTTQVRFPHFTIRTLSLVPVVMPNKVRSAPLNSITNIESSTVPGSPRVEQLYGRLASGRFEKFKCFL